MLYLVATPIGNLSDFSFRAIETIKECDYLLCEDTRRSRILLNHYEIQKPLKSYHLFNESSRLLTILNDLKAGKTLGLLSDAGTPLINDPGEKIVKACIESNIEIRSIPGATSVMTALVLSGFPCERFQFVGFLPKKGSKRKKALIEYLDYPGTTVCFESPFRLAKTLQELGTLNSTKKVFVGREFTKKFESHYHGLAPELALHFTAHPPKGEIVLIF